MAETEPSFKPNPKALVSDLYKEIAKWLVELAKPLVTTAAVATGVFVAGKFAVFGSFLVSSVQLQRYQLFLWITLGAAAGICLVALHLGRKLRTREADAAEKLQTPSKPPRKNALRSRMSPALGFLNLSGNSPLPKPLLPPILSPDFLICENWSSGFRARSARRWAPRRRFP